MQRFFFINTYDNISGAMLSHILNQHHDIHCSLSLRDPFLPCNNRFEYQLDQTTSNIKVDDFISKNTSRQAKLSGNAQFYSTFELHHKSLAERTNHPFKQATILLNPKNRINLLLHSWRKSGIDDQTLVAGMLKQIDDQRKAKDALFRLYHFQNMHGQIMHYVRDNQVCDLENPSDMLFVIALIKTIAHDTAELPSSCKKFRLESLLQDEEYFADFFNHISSQSLDGSESQFDLPLKNILEQQYANLKRLTESSWEPWQKQLLDKFIITRLETIYFSHVDKPLSYFYEEVGYDHLVESTRPSYTKLVSIQFNSNRPAQITTYFDNIEETVENPDNIEIIVNIDHDDEKMKATLEREIASRPFTIKYITSDRPGSFCDLWKPINSILKVTDPGAYFLLNISDEMLFEEKGWDTTLAKYVGLFPDNIFRLRASRNKFRHYFDPWECSFCQDSIAFVTKKWIDIGGDWNPCFGPDSFQQLISYYLYDYGRFANNHYSRDIPILDIKLKGDIPFIGVDDEGNWDRCREHIDAMLICQSYPMQLEAKRRAVRIIANIIAYNQQFSEYEIKDEPTKKIIRLIVRGKKPQEITLSYHLSRTKIFLRNNLRKIAYFQYFGGGRSSKNYIITCLQFLKSKYHLFRHIYDRTLMIAGFPYKNASILLAKSIVKRILFIKKKTFYKKPLNSVEEQTSANLKLKNELLSDVQADNPKITSMAS